MTKGNNTKKCPICPQKISHTCMAQGKRIQYNLEGERVEKIEEEWNEELEYMFNEAVQLCLSFVKQEITEKKRDAKLAALDESGKEVVRKEIQKAREEGRQLEQERIVGIVKKSRTIDETYGIGVKEEQARSQVVADIIQVIKG